MTFLTYLFSFLVLISIIVFIHELGHFSFARIFGVRVLDFSIGFGKSLKTWKTKSNTHFNLRILPVGGFVKMKGEEISDVEKADDSFNSKEYYQKLLITLGGPLFNFILAIFIFLILNLYGVFKITPLIGDVLPNSQAEQAGLLKGDLILEIDSSEISSYSDSQLELSKRLGNTGSIIFLVSRNDRILEYSININSWLSNEEPSNLLSSLGIIPPLEPEVGNVLPLSPAEKGGIEIGDRILEINGKPIDYWGDIKDEINYSQGEELLISVSRNQEEVLLKIKPKLSEKDFTWQVGIASSYLINQKTRKLVNYGFIVSLQNSVSQTYSVIENSLLFFKKIIFGQVSAKNLGGPVMIGQYAGESVIYGGLYSFVYLIAFISISLGIVNLLPLPILDGGQALILTIEKIIGRNLPEKLLDFFYRIGTFMLLFLFIFVFYNDIFRIIN